MIEREEEPRDLAALVVGLVGSVAETGDPWEPYRLLDPAGMQVDPVAVFLRDLQAIGRPATTQRSYALALLRWFRFLWAVEIGWDRAPRAEARDFCCWMQVADKPVGVHWRPRGAWARAAAARIAVSGGPNAITGKSAPGRGYAARTRAHSETVLRGVSTTCTGWAAGLWSIRSRWTGPAGRVVRTPITTRWSRSAMSAKGCIGPRPLPVRPGAFLMVCSMRCSRRCRATGTGPWSPSRCPPVPEPQSCSVRRRGDADAGQQLITVIRKGTRALQPLPASPDAFVWLRLYQTHVRGLVPLGRDQPLWWTLRRPFRPLSYHAAHRMFERVNAGLGANWTLHDLRHTAAYRMARDPGLPLTDVQWVLGHAQLCTTQLYSTQCRKR